MGCENKSCDSCACDKNTVPETLPEERVVYVERPKPAETGFWAFFWGMLFGSFFLGC